jgi:ABC-type nitrate/sulfonate/bicarbonate transport system substrate-binding protein
MSGTDSELFIRPDSGITSLKDLEGKKVSYGVGGGAKELFLRFILNNEHVDITKINFIEIENPYLHIALMEKKDVDAVLISDSHFVDEANKLGAIVLPEWQAKNYRKLPTGLTVSANTDFLNKNEENVISFFKAIIESHRFLKDHLDESAVIISKYLMDKTDGALDVKPDEFMNLVNEGRVTYVLWEDTTTIVEMARISYETGQYHR